MVSLQGDAIAFVLGGLAEAAQARTLQSNIHDSINADPGAKAQAGFMIP